MAVLGSHGGSLNLMAIRPVLPLNLMAIRPVLPVTPPVVMSTAPRDLSMTQRTTEKERPFTGHNKTKRTFTDVLSQDMNKNQVHLF